MKTKIRFVSILTLLLALIVGFSTLLLWHPSAVAGDAAGVLTRLDPGVLQWGYLAAAIATGLSSLGAAYAVAQVGTAAVGALTEKPELLGRLVVLVGLAEGIAIYGVIISVLILNSLGG